LWLRNGEIAGPHFSFTWYRGSPIARERNTEELQRATVKDISIDGHSGFVAVANDAALGDSLCEIGINSSSSDDYFEWSISFTEKPFPDACGVATELSRQSIEALANAQINTVQAGAPNGSADQFPNLLKECEVTSDELARTVGADPLDIQSTYVGAVCRWQAATPSIDITRFWFERGNLDNERRVADKLKYQVENQSVAGVPSIVMRANDDNGACGVASDAAGVVGWWVNPRSPGVDACAQATKLMELSLAKNP
jgi:hypothetical protein